MKRILILAVGVSVGLASGTLASPPRAQKGAAPDSAYSDSLSAASMLPLTAPLKPLPSGALTNVDAARMNWELMQQRLLTGQNKVPVRPWIMLERSRFGGVNNWNEYYMPEWEKTPQQVKDREAKRQHLGPDGKPIKKP